MEALVVAIALVILLVNILGFYIVWRGVQGMEQAVTAISQREAQRRLMGDLEAL